MLPSTRLSPVGSTRAISEGREGQQQAESEKREASEEAASFSSSHFPLCISLHHQIHSTPIHLPTYLPSHPPVNLFAIQLVLVIKLKLTHTSDLSFLHHPRPLRPISHLPEHFPRAQSFPNPPSVFPPTLPQELKLLCRRTHGRQAREEGGGRKRPKNE